MRIKLTSVFDTFRLHADELIKLSTNIIDDHVQGRQVGAGSSVDDIKSRQHAVGTIGNALHPDQCYQKHV